MECGYARLTVWFADPFWVGVYEREAEGRLGGCRHTFGAAPVPPGGGAPPSLRRGAEGRRGLAVAPVGVAGPGL